MSKLAQFLRKIDGPLALVLTIYLLGYGLGMFAVGVLVYLVISSVAG